MAGNGTDLEHALAALESRLTWRLSVTTAAIIGIIISVLKLTQSGTAEPRCAGSWAVLRRRRP